MAEPPDCPDQRRQCQQSGQHKAEDAGGIDALIIIIIVARFEPWQAVIRIEVKLGMIVDDITELIPNVCCRLARLRFSACHGTINGLADLLSRALKPFAILTDHRAPSQQITFFRQPLRRV